MPNKKWFEKTTEAGMIEFLRVVVNRDFNDFETSPSCQAIYELIRTQPQKLKKSADDGFMSGLLYSCQQIALFQNDPETAIWMIRESGLPIEEFLACQKKSGHQTRQMNKIIREAFDI